jgi:hypothetical protein
VTAAAQAALAAQPQQHACSSRAMHGVSLAPY